MWGKKTRNAADFLRYISATGRHCFLLASVLSDAAGDDKTSFQIACDSVEVCEEDRTVKFVSADKWGSVVVHDVLKIKIGVENKIPRMIELEYVSDENAVPEKHGNVFVFVLPAEMRTKGGPIHEAAKV